MNQKTTTIQGLAFRIWLLTSLIFSIGSIYSVGGFAIIIMIVAVVFSFPVFIALLIAIPQIKKTKVSCSRKCWLLFLCCFVCTLPYGIIGPLFFDDISFSENALTKTITRYLVASGILFACSLLSLLFQYRNIITLFFVSPPSNYLSFQTIQNMENFEQAPLQTPNNKSSNKVLIKAGITGIFILVMLIPTLFISSLVSEREVRQNNVVTEVMGKWAGPQTLTGPYLYIPYTVNNKDAKGNIVKTIKKLIILPEHLNVIGKIFPEIRPRSIYKVLLYKSDITAHGSFTLQIPKNIDLTSLRLNEAKICLGISDFKGIQEKIVISFSGTDYELSPGIPINDIDSSGLSSDIHLSLADLNQARPFRLNVKIKGSKQLYFVPLSGNSQFNLQSTWKNPSFDGIKIPDRRDVSDSGFNASWSFNKANLPFGTVLKEIDFKKNDFAFGVTMIQPADQYTKTDRCIKYALLFIGLTFVLFFIVELMQKKPLHPVQYTMVGVALLVFFTLLLSISEFVLFDYAYLIAAFATVALITFYAKGHFKSWKTSTVFAGVLTALYTFIFILVRLEDTALLIGSIGLFIVLALVMHASRKINWYDLSPNE